MKVFFRRYLAFLLASVALGSLPWAVAQSHAPSDLAGIPTRLEDRHPATLAGRMDRVQTTYVDLYAPLTPGEWRCLETNTERWLQKP